MPETFISRSFCKQLFRGCQCHQKSLFETANLFENTQKQPPEVFYEKRCSQKFNKIHRKHLCQSPFFKPQACNFIKKETPAEVFSREFCEISKNIFFIEHLWATASEYLQYVRCRSSVWNFPLVSFSKIFSIWNTYFQEHLRVFFIHFFFLSLFQTAMCQAKIYSLFLFVASKNQTPCTFSYKLFTFNSN